MAHKTYEYLQHGRLAPFLLWFGGKPATLRRVLRSREILWRRGGFYFVCDLFLYRFLQSFFCFFIHDKDYSVNRQDVRQVSNGGIKRKWSRHDGDPNIVESYWWSKGGLNSWPPAPAYQIIQACNRSHRLSNLNKFDYYSRRTEAIANSPSSSDLILNYCEVLI